VAGRRIVATLLAAAGVVMAHGLGYLSSYPRAVSRRDALEGHEYLEALGAVVVAGGVATVVWLVVLASRRVEVVQRLGPRWPKLAGLQMAGFLALELVERLGSAADFFTEPAVLIGALLQVPVAWLLVRTIEAGSAVMCRAVSRSAAWSIRWPVTGLAPAPQLRFFVADAVLCWATSPRGPPLRSV